MILDGVYLPVLAVVGSGTYFYLSGITMFTRVCLKKHGKKVGSLSSEHAAYVFGTIWILSADIMTVLANSGT